MGPDPRLCIFLLLSVLMMGYCHAENERVLIGEGALGRVIVPAGGSWVRGMKRRSLEVDNGGGESRSEVEDYQDPSANPKHNPPSPP